jgi:hypothetical protein
MIAAGGALGGIFVAVGAPALFSDYLELHWGLVACAALLLFVWLGERPRIVAQREEVPDSAGSSTETAEGVVAAANPPQERNPQGKEWLWLAGALSLLAFVGIDRFLVWLGPQFKSAPRAWFISARLFAWSLLALWGLSWIFRRRRYQTMRAWAVVCAWLLISIFTLATVLARQARGSPERIYCSRNFYGVLSVFEYSKQEPAWHYFLLQHGRITHGLQFVDPRQATWPTSYYGEGSGVNIAVQSLPEGERRIGVVGLGTGTMAAFGRPGDYLRIYEINPEVQRLATSQFTYLTNCPAKVDVALGDARLSMEREAPQQFDLLALDAFSSDAIPVHLLTREAFELYNRHLKTNGIIAVHISNHYLDLEPVVVNLARHFNYQLAMIDYDEDDEEGQWWLYSSTWILLSPNKELFERPLIKLAKTSLNAKAAKIPLWTDDFTSVFQILRK